jgi:hypothetical protein
MPTSESDFLSGDCMTEVLKRVARGRGARIATAFWSKVGIDELFGPAGMGGASIVCDIAMGSTSPKALEALGAPGNDDLRHHERLHAKVFISDEGLVVGSANVSNAALGTGHLSRWQLEAGTFHAAHSPAWSQAVEWFDALHGRSPGVGQDELDWAGIVYRPPLPGPRGAPRRGSLLDLVAVAPVKFAGVSFVVARMLSTDKQIKRALKSAKALGTGIPAKEIDAWPRSSMFTDWESTDVDKWKKTFVEFWIGPRKVSVFGYRDAICDRANGSVLGRRDWRAIARESSLDIPERQAISRLDAGLARLLPADAEGAIFKDGAALAKRIAELRRSHPAEFVGWTAEPNDEIDPFKKKKGR